MNFDTNAIGEISALLSKRPEAQSAFGYVLATVISYNLPLPSAPVAGEKQWYLDSLDGGVRSLLDQVNEAIVIPVLNVNRIVFGLWRLRYHMLYNPQTLPLPSLMASIEAYYLSPDDKIKLAAVDSEDVQLLTGILSKHFGGQLDVLPHLKEGVSRPQSIDD